MPPFAVSEAYESMRIRKATKITAVREIILGLKLLSSHSSIEYLTPLFVETISIFFNMLLSQIYFDIYIYPKNPDELKSGSVQIHDLQNPKDLYQIAVRY